VSVQLIQGNALHLPLADESIQCVVTSPPYWGLRDYGTEGQLGLESTPEAYVANLVAVFREVRRVLRPDGTLWLNLGDSYANKQLQGIPWRVAFALQADGWWLRSDIIWAKPNPMPESVTDRPTRSHEYLFLLTKSARYYYDAQAIAEPAVYGPERAGSRAGYAVGVKGHNTDGRPNFRSSRGDRWTETRNKRDVWAIQTRPFNGAHFATMPVDLVEPCIKAGSRPGDVVLDPFSGAGTVGVVATRFGRHAIGVDLNPAYNEMARERLAKVQPALEGIQ
jgi:DNA modification methylase